MTRVAIPPTSRMVARFAEEIGGKPVGKKLGCSLYKSIKKKI
ncbi:MAG: hypothetical protein AVDCRST_MAG96-4257 [uncultured Segetibacter sp.]|uniref:Uncharacterized protein n=1 Tax=uncultured Segetibacter sp. TaxID=481133 RepID=A0A6J4U765_9BACT|nr:MAG: hypothetical protein AVDCRST_MAG96-4257 [uncultured Segetibacter sp.]